MKKTVFILTLCLLVVSCGNSTEQTNGVAANEIMPSKSFKVDATANPYAKQFGLDVEHYFDSYNKATWDQVIETTYRPLFGNKTNEEITTQYIQAKIQGMERHVEVKRIAKISDVVSHGNYSYSKIFLDADVTVKMSGALLERKDFMRQNLELSYDTQDLIFDEANNSFTIPDAYVQMIAISEKGSNLWKYIEVDKQKEPAYAQIIPPNVLAQLDN